MPYSTTKINRRKQQTFKLPRRTSKRRVEKPELEITPTTCHTVNYNQDLKSFAQLPVIILDHENLTDGHAYFLIDSGSQLNLTKENAITSKCQINFSKIYSLTSIGSGILKTLGKITLKIKNINITFNIVDNNFPIEQTGIIGVPFLCEQEATLQFRNKLPGKLLVHLQEFSFC